jgi:hypothetical protein
MKLSDHQPSDGRRQGQNPGMRVAVLGVGLTCVFLAGCGGGGRESGSSSPAAGGGYLAWTSGDERFAQTGTLAGNVYVRRGGATLRVNPAGTRGITGGIDRGRLVFQELDGHGSHLRLFDLRKRRFIPVPGSLGRIVGVFWKPTIAGRFVLFGEIAAGWDILLADLRTGQTTTLERNRAHAGYSVPGQIDGRYAVWLSCAEIECHVLEYDVSTRRRREIPTGGDARRVVEGPSVAPDGAVYYGQSGLECGSDVAIYRYRPGGGVTKVMSLPHGVDFQYSYAERVPGGVRVLFDRYDCRQKRFQIASLLDRAG